MSAKPAPRGAAARSPAPSKAVAEPLAPAPTMSARIALMSEDELAGLRSRIAQLTKMGNPDQRMASMRQLETIDVEMERRLAPAPA